MPNRRSLMGNAAGPCVPQRRGIPFQLCEHLVETAVPVFSVGSWAFRAERLSDELHGEVRGHADCTEPGNDLAEGVQRPQAARDPAGANERERLAVPWLES